MTEEKEEKKGMFSEKQLRAIAETAIDAAKKQFKAQEITGSLLEFMQGERYFMKLFIKSFFVENDKLVVDMKTVTSAMKELDETCEKIEKRLKKMF